MIFYCFYLGFFSILYFLYFSISSKKIIDIFLLVSLGYAMAYLGKHTWFSHSFLFTNACLLLGFSLLISGNVLTKLKYFLITLIGMYFFMFSFNLMAESFYRNKAVAEMKNSFMDFLSQYPKTKSVYFFATDIQMAAQTLSYFPSMKFASRFSFFWMLPGMIKQPFLLKNHPYLEQDKNFLIKMIAEDLIRNKPGLIFIDKKQQKNQLYLVNLSHYCSVNVKPISFDYLSYFSQNKLFQTAWKPYHYIMTIKKEGLFGPSYEFAVYAR